MLPGLLLFIVLSLFFGFFFVFADRLHRGALDMGLRASPAATMASLHAQGEDLASGLARPAPVGISDAARRASVDLTLLALIAGLAAAYGFHLPLVLYFHRRRRGQPVAPALIAAAKRRIFRSPEVMAFAVPLVVVLLSLFRYAGSKVEAGFALMLPIEASLLALTTLFTYLWQKHRLRSLYLPRLFTAEELSKSLPGWHRTRLSGDILLMLSLSTFLPIIVVLLFLATGISWTESWSKLGPDQVALLFGTSGAGAQDSSLQAGLVRKGLESLGLADPRLPLMAPLDVVRVVLGLGIGLFIILIYVYFIARWTAEDIIRPVETLRANMGRATLGDLAALTPALASNELGELTIGFNAMLRGIAERERIKLLFGQYLTKEISEAILDGRVKLDGARYEATVMFTDIRGFTTMAEGLPPEEVFAFLNDYLARMIEVIAARGGIIDKFLGDGILAVFGLPVPNATHADDALGAALDMRGALEAMNAARRAEGRADVSIGIGMHSGPVIAGNVGSAKKLQYTVIGDTVNLASRIEGLNRDYGSYLLMSSSTWELLGEGRRGLAFERLEAVAVRGKAGPVDLYRLADLP
jgi:class 3 adenylate cyclase